LIAGLLDPRMKDLDHFSLSDAIEAWKVLQEEYEKIVNLSTIIPIPSTITPETTISVTPSTIIPESTISELTVNPTIPTSKKKERKRTT